jgi:quinol monooxygenase YgiN
MTASLLVVAVGAVAAAVGTAGLTARCSRTPSMFLGAWTVALFALTVALAAEALGYLSGFSDLIFRVSEITSQAIAPLAICLGLAELIARSIVVRFVMRLAVAAIGVIALVIMASDPLNPAVSLSKDWPDPAVTYQLVPTGLIKLLAVFAVITSVIAALAVVFRSGRGTDYAEVVRPGLTGSAAAILAAAPGAAMLAGKSAHATGFAFAIAASAGLIWFAATTAARRGLGGAGASSGRRRRQADDSGWSQPQARPGGGYREYEAGPDYAGRGHRDGAGYDRYGPAGRGDTDEPESDIRYPALAALAAEQLQPPGHDPDSYNDAHYDSGGSGSAGYDDGYDSGPFYGEPPRPAGYDAASGRYGRPEGAGDGDPAGGAELHPNLFGQITIYTLLEDRIDDFDQLTEQVVEQVRADEPGTLVYIVHAVPTAPMQRILYEVYQHRTAYEDHLAQAYMTRFAAERRSMVLASNAIELGLQQAKVSPLASYDAISDMLSESGIDLTGVTRSARGTAGAGGDGRGGAGSRGWPEPGGDWYPPDRDDRGHRYGGRGAGRDEDEYP